MLLPPISQIESSRLVVLRALNILDTSSDIPFDYITRFAAEKLDVPICLIIFIELINFSLTKIHLRDDNDASPTSM